jgi:hypothetical protein
MRITRSVSVEDDKRLAKAGKTVAIAANPTEAILLTSGRDENGKLLFYVHAHLSVTAAAEGDEIIESAYYINSVGFVEPFFDGLAILTEQDSVRKWELVYATARKRVASQCCMHGNAKICPKLFCPRAKIAALTSVRSI